MKITLNDKNKIIKLFQTHTYTKKAIAKECHCSVDTVNRVLEKAGLKPIQLSDKLQAISSQVLLLRMELLLMMFYPLKYIKMIWAFYNLLKRKLIHLHHLLRQETVLR